MFSSIIVIRAVWIKNPFDLVHVLLIIPNEFFFLSLDLLIDELPLMSHVWFEQ